MASTYQGNDAANPNAYTFMLAYNLKAYAIKFDNQEALGTLVEIYNTPERQRKFITAFLNYERLSNQAGETASQNELIELMFNIFSDFDLEISLFKAEVDTQNFVTSWNKVNKETLTEEPCN